MAISPDTDEYGLGAEAFSKAVADCGIDKNQVDGLLVCRVPYYARMGEVLGIDPRWTLSMPPHGRMSGMGLIEATIALASGQCELCGADLCQYRPLTPGQLWRRGSAIRLGSLGVHVTRRLPRDDVPGGTWNWYGTTTRQLAEVSVAFRHHACLNPDAVMTKPITIDEHETARPIVAPLRLLDYCLINDGAVCMILTTAERAPGCGENPGAAVRLRRPGGVPCVVDIQFRR